MIFGLFNKFMVKFAFPTISSATIIAAPAFNFLPDDTFGAGMLGIIGGLLRWGVTKKPWKDARFEILTSIGFAVFFTGFQVPWLKEHVSPDAYWRINTLIIAIFGATVLGEGFDYIGALFKKKKEFELPEKGSSEKAEKVETDKKETGQ